ncbi:hypothetical protein ASD06_09405 [Angustibacter sp. Root456]|nr:hypothetical protein ASD06_09405 [Angustibacter sp. Root456]
MRQPRGLAVGAARALIVAASTTALLCACSGGAPEANPTPTRTANVPSVSPSASPTPTSRARPPEQHDSLVATAVVRSVAAHRSPGGPVSSTWKNPRRAGVPLTFRVVAARGGWLQVQLPQRPNGSTGWVVAADVRLTRVSYRLVVSTEDNTLTLFDGGVRVARYTVATGTGGTPTPHGSFYLTELLSPTNHGYGPFAFGLSAFSEALSSFGGGPGQIGLHGTDDSSSIGHSVSHGCIRMTNRDITALAHLLPLGTPITIR